MTLGILNPKIITGFQLKDIAFKTDWIQLLNKCKRLYIFSYLRLLKIGIKIYSRERHLCVIQHIRAALAGSFYRLFITPFINDPGITVKQYLWYFHTPEVCRAGIYRGCQQIILERIE